jgi:hypothetical protein
MVAIKEIIKVRQFLSFFVTLLSIMKKMFAISLSLLLFLSSTGLTYAQHFCGGRVVNEAIMIGEKFLGCHEEVSAEGYSGHLEEMPNCCEDIYLQVDTDDQYTPTSFDLDLDTIFFVSFVNVFLFEALEILSEKEIIFSEYSPPPIPKDLPVL